MTTVSIRELHARTGHFVRAASLRDRIVVTDRGVPVAELNPCRVENAADRWKRRRILPEYARIMNKPMGGDSTLGISADRDNR